MNTLSKNEKGLKLSELLLNMKAVDISFFGRKTGIKNPVVAVDIASIELVTPEKNFKYFSENDIEYICNRFLEIDATFLDSILKNIQNFRNDYFNEISSPATIFHCIGKSKTIKLETKVKKISSKSFPIWKWKDKNGNIISRDEVLYNLYEENFVPSIMSSQNKEKVLKRNSIDSSKANIEYFIKEIKDNCLIKLKKSLEKKIQNYLRSKKKNKIDLYHLEKDIFYLKEYLQIHKVSDNYFKSLNLNKKETDKFFKKLFEEKYSWSTERNKVLKKMNSLIEEPLSLRVSKDKQIEYLKKLIY